MDMVYSEIAVAIPLSPRIPDYVEYMASLEAVMWGIRERPTPTLD